MWELPKTDIVMHFPYANIFFSEWELTNARAVKKRQIIQIRVLLSSIWEFTNSTTRQHTLMIAL